MRSGVWWSAAALLLFAVASSALRSSQVESTRTSRRFSTKVGSRASTSTEKIEDVHPTFRPRSPKRREEPTSSTSYPVRDNVRSRARSRTTDYNTSNIATEQSPTENGGNERFDSRRTTRVRSRPVESDANVVTTYANQDIPTKNKVRQSNRRTQYTSTEMPAVVSSVIDNTSTRSVNRRTPPVSTEAPLKVSSPDFEDIRTEIISSTFDDFTRTVPKEEDMTTVQFKRRSSTARPVENEATTKPTRSRGRINTRTSVKLDDMASSGATNVLTFSEKNTISEKLVEEPRNSRKLRYRSRFSEADTNLTGEGITNSNEIAKSASKKQSFNDRVESRTPPSPRLSEKNMQRQSERKPSQSTTVKSMRVVRRPLSRSKDNSPSSTASSKVKTSDEIGDDDNYPETFKALIQAKNASTQVSSPPSESLSVKATHTVINTFTQSPPPSNTSREPNLNHTRLRSKLNQTENDLKSEFVEDNKITESTSNKSKSKSQEYRLRGTYSPKPRKLSTLSSEKVTSSSTTSPIKTSYKFTRKIKPSTTEPPKSEKSVKTKRFEPGQPSQKSVVRTTFNTRRSFGKPSAPTAIVSDMEVKNLNETRTVSKRAKLPRTPFSRSRGKALNSESTSTVVEATPTADKKIENTAEMPLIFTLMNKPDKISTTYNGSASNRDDHKDEFLIAVSSKESQENNVVNEIVTKGEETENNPIINVLATTQKYHSNYKDQTLSDTDGNKSSANSPATPIIRNLQTRKFNRKTTKSAEKFESTSVLPLKRSKERTLRKYSDTFSKTTEASNNGITYESEKPKSRFSSKYRASYLDKQFYKPTVPTVTSTTAWLKFFVTDHHLTQLIQEPQWFEGIDHNDVTTELMSRSNITAPFIHDSSPELVVGEEIQLGPDMNAISFTQSRSTLSSADLRLSETLAKPSQVMNVEASNHSPSVTVSIFDALAEILTSTPRVQISSTTEVPQQIFTDSVVKQTLNGVSSNDNVNSVSDTSNQGTSITTDNIKTTTYVQITDQTTPIVLNRLSVGETSPSLKTEDINFMATNIPPSTVTPTQTTPISTSRTTPIPTTPTTPITERKPFAIKVLYSDTESPTDKLMTSSTTPFTTIWGTTDNPKMVYNTVSDLLLSNNNLVSAELTSMLSNNIKDIIQNLDENSRSKLSVDMAKLLETLIPRAMDKFSVLTDIDSTTPYSLEEIKDTENIDIGNKENLIVNKTNLLQNVPKIDVNITQQTVDSVANTAEDMEKDVNSIENSPTVLSSTSLEMESMTTVADIKTRNSFIVTDSPQFDFITTTQATTSGLNLEITDTATLSNFEIDSSIVNQIKAVTSPSLIATNKPSPFPFYTNSNFDELNLSNINNPSMVGESLSSHNIDNIDIDDPSQITRLQLWVLSKKARVLKIIEQLIREHNNEIKNPPLTEIINEPNNIQLSSRLSDIISTMNSTTISPETNLGLTSPNSTPNPEYELEITTIQADITDTTTETLRNRLGVDFTIPTTTVLNDILLSSTPESVENISTNGNNVFAPENATDIDNTDTTLLTTSTESIEKTTLEEPTEGPDLSENFITTTENTPVTIQTNTEFLTTSIDIESTTETSFSTESNLETTTQSGIETTTVTLLNESKSNGEIIIASRNNVVTQPTIPKKDYVIFGILPNNTVVRKDPNDNVLETLTEASPYIVYGVLPNNTVIRKFPNGTRVPRIMQKIDVLPISPWSLRNPYSPIHNNPAIVRPQSNPIRVSTNTVISTATNNEMENRLTTDTVNNQQTMISSSALNVKDSSSFGITTATTKPSAEKSTASHVLSLRTTTMLPSIHEILLNSLSSATKEEMVISSMTSSTREPRILTLDIDPETKQIRTEKPDDEKGNTVFKFIPIDEVTVSPQNTNVQKLASTKATTISNTEKELQTVTPMAVTETNSPILQIETRINSIDDPTTTIKPVAGTPSEIISIVMNGQPSMPLMVINSIPNTTERKSASMITTTVGPKEDSFKITLSPEQTTTQSPIKSILSPSENTDTTTDVPNISTTVLTTAQFTFESPTTSTPGTTQNVIRQNVATTFSMDATTELIGTTEQLTPRPTEDEQKNSNKNQVDLLQTLLAVLSTTSRPATLQENDQIKLLQALLLATGQKPSNNLKTNPIPQSTTLRSIKDDLRQFEEDTKLLKTLLQVTGRNPNELNIPSINDIKPIITESTSTKPTTTSTSATTTQFTTIQTTTEAATKISDEIKNSDEDVLLLQQLLQATGQNPNNLKLPIISGITSNIRIASNPLTTNVESNPTTQMNIRPIYTTSQRTQKFNVPTEIPQTVLGLSTLQEQSTVTEGGISTTYTPVERRIPSSTSAQELLPTLSGRSGAVPLQITTEVPSTSTFSVEEDLAFLKNLKTVLNTNSNDDDPEAALANRVIALAVERSLSEIQTGKQPDPIRSGKTINLNADNVVAAPTTKRTVTTTTRTTTTTTVSPEIYSSTPSLEDDIKQFEEDTKLLQALLQATGQDPSKFNIPQLPSINVSPNYPPIIDEDLKILSNLLASPSPLNEPFDPLMQKPGIKVNQGSVVVSNPTTTKPLGAKIAVKDNLQSVNDDAQLLQTLIKLKDAQETTTQRNKLAITGQSSDEALKKLIQQAQPTAMVSEATKPSISLSTEYGNSNDALLAALLKEQGFGPTTASSLDEQIRLAALLNQVVVTPKARRTTTPPPPPPAPRRPILDGLAWLWQQWRDTAPGTGDSGTRTNNRRPAPAARPSPSPTAAPPRANWFGSGPFVGNADDRPSSNRIPLEPPRAVAAEQTPGRGQLVSAAINVTRAFSQFLGAAIQGAAQTVQNVIRAGQKAATDVYTNGSG